VLALTFVASLIGVAYIATTPQETSESFTEFYALSPEGNASEYPTDLSVGETGTLSVGITNHEHEETVYTVLVVFENRTTATRTATVAAGRSWNGEFSFTPESAGRKKLRILLYRGGEAIPSQEAYRNLRLWVTVSE
jgi:uncharacterized membrane protein